MAAVALLAIGGASRVAAITVKFDYTYDAATGFFGTATAPTPARLALEFAGRTFEGFSDNLARIQPGGVNSWTAHFTNPGNGVPTSVYNLLVPSNQIIVFAGAYDLPNLPVATLAEASPGNASFPLGSSPTSAFVDAVRNRGQGNELADFATWGGRISFDTLAGPGVPRNWHFDLNSAPPLGAYDFYTSAVHELAHVLGFGLSTAFDADFNPNTFQFFGPTTVALYGQPVPFTSNKHFGALVTSPPFAEGTKPKPSLAAVLPLGVRKLFTPLDYAVMTDIGWQTPPEL
jgi:hypothetical protein